MLISTQGIFRFDKITKEMYLAQIHSEVKVEDIRKEVPWDLKIAPDLSQTEAPTTEEVEFIRRFSPAMSAGRKLSQDLVVANIMKKMAARAQSYK
ncbi:MAG: hypothetical protein HY787_02490 [Deltaproteobacteria bacterium]|nr:hypothetical protein [Deltaproteobacteria bacterium]